MRKDPYAKERAEFQKTKPEEAVAEFFDLFLENAKGEDGKTPEKGVDYWTEEEKTELVSEILSKIPTPKDGKDVDYGIVLDYITQEVTKQVSKIPPPENGKDAVVDIPSIVASLLEVMPKIEATTVDYLGIKDYIDKQISLIKPESKTIKSFTGGGATSLRQLTDVVLDGLMQDSKGNYILAPSASTADWTYYATKWDTAPTVNTTITGGTVYNYTLDGVTRYRFVADTYSPSTDAFYTTFVNPTLSGLITTRSS